MFSGFYLVLLLILFFLIVRVVAFEWRAKGEGTRWRAIWLWANAVGSAGIAVIWGIGLANLLHGVPIDSDGHYAGTFWDLFSGYTLLGGLAFALVFVSHGASYLTLRTSGELCVRARHAARLLAAPPLRSAARTSSGRSPWRWIGTTRTSSRPCCPPRSRSRRSSRRRSSSTPAEAGSHSRSAPSAR